MIEMMAVVAIVILLFTMLIPAIRTIHNKILWTNSKSTIMMISAACDKFALDWDKFTINNE